jgi:lipopolysaccharide transport protein LptA
VKMINNICFPAWCVAAWLIACGAGIADANTVITASQMLFDYHRSIASFQGNVVVMDPEFRLKSDNLHVIFEGTNAVRSVTATGNVRVWQADKVATCRKAIYIAKKGEITLIGDAKLQRGNDAVSGDEITFWVNENRMICRPGRLVIFPSGDQQNKSLEALIKPGTRKGK